MNPARVFDVLIAHVTRRAPDFVIGGDDRPYLRRWWLTPWRGWTERAKNSRRRTVRAMAKAAELLPNVYLHQFLRSDDDRALHDHPWCNVSILLRGTYTEHTVAAGGINRRDVLAAGDVRVRWSGRLAHRIELHNGPCWTLFITGPRVREWGFYCMERGFVHWKVFTAADDHGAVGKGCDQ